MGQSHIYAHIFAYLCNFFCIFLHVYAYAYLSIESISIHIFSILCIF